MPPEIIERQVSNVNVVDVDSTRLNVDKTKQNLEQTRLASSSPTDYTNLLSVPCLKCHVVKCQWQAISIPQTDLLETDATF